MKTKTKAPKLTAAQKALVLGDRLDTLNSRLAELADNPLTINFTAITRDANTLAAFLDRAARKQRKSGSGRPILIITV